MQKIPPGPTVSLEHAKQLHPKSKLPARIAAHLLPLSGVQNPAAGDGHTRCLAYPDLTVTAIRRGAPSDIPNDSLIGGQQAIIATGTIDQFRPDSLAALVLTGANFAFAPIVRAYNRILLGGFMQKLSPRIRLGVAAGLGFQAFREQPGLFALAVQAKRIQDAKVNGNLRGFSDKGPQSRDESFSNTPTTFEILRIFEKSTRDIDRGRLPLSDIFAENCLMAARKPNATIQPPDPGYVVPKVIFHPGEFAMSFLEDISQSPQQDEWLEKPLRVENADYTTLMAAWIVNDLSCIYLDEEREGRSFQLANYGMELRMKSALEGFPLEQNMPPA